MKTNFRRSLILTCLLVAALLALPAAVQAQFNYTTNNGTITITGYTGSGGAVTIPDTINGLRVSSIGDGAFEFSGLTGVTIGDGVTSIGNYAFVYCTSLTRVTIGNSVTSIGGSAFYNDTALTSVTIGNSVTDIGDVAFEDCYNLTGVTIPNNVTSIGNDAFEGCYNLTSVTIGNGVTSIGDDAFGGTALTKVFFAGNAPTADSSVFDYGGPIVYYLPGAFGWGNTFAGRPTALWFRPQPLILNEGPGFGVQSGQFGFTISWATNVPVVVEACANLSNPVWSPMATNTLTGGTSYFSDPQSSNYPARFYRLRSP